jgi:small subunit ribosomal protein S20
LSIENNSAKIKNMPLTKSAKKALRQSLRRRKHNLFYKRKIKALIKEVEILISEKKKEEAQKLLPQIYKVLDKAAKEKVIKKNTADRKKSNLAKKISKLSNQ